MFPCALFRTIPRAFTQTFTRAFQWVSCSLCVPSSDSFTFPHATRAPPSFPFYLNVPVTLIQTLMTKRRRNNGTHMRGRQKKEQRCTMRLPCVLLNAFLVYIVGFSMRLIVCYMGSFLTFSCAFHPAFLGKFSSAFPVHFSSVQQCVRCAFC